MKPRCHWRNDLHQHGVALYPVVLVLLAALLTALAFGWFARQALEREAGAGDRTALAIHRDLQGVRLQQRLESQRRAMAALASLPAFATQHSEFSVVADAVDPPQPGSDRVAAWQTQGMPAGLSALVWADASTGAVRWAGAADEALALPADLADAALADLPLGRAFDSARQPLQEARSGLVSDNAPLPAPAIRLSAFGRDAGDEATAWFAAPLLDDGPGSVLLGRTSLRDLEQWLQEPVPATGSAESRDQSGFVLSLAVTDGSMAGGTGGLNDADGAGDNPTANGGNTGLVAAMPVALEHGGLSLTVARPARTDVDIVDSLLIPAGAASALAALLLGALAWRRSAAQPGHDRASLTSMTAQRDDMLALQARDNDAINDSIERIIEAVGVVTRSHDLTQRVPVTEDVTGAIADALNALNEETARSVAAARTRAAGIAEGSTTLLGRATDVESQTGAQRDELHLAIQDMSRSVSAISHANRQASLASAASRRADEAGERASKAVRATADTVRRARDLIRQTEKRVKRLGEHSQEIGQVVGIIDGIAERTGILALNTSLQAAAAGDAGRQFAGLADEVKRLSRSASQATAQIGRMVTAIQTETADSVTAVSGAIMQIVEISELVGEADAAIHDVRSDARAVIERLDELALSVAEQAAASDALERRSRQLATASEQVLGSLRGQADEARKLAEHALRLDDILGKYQTGNA